MKLALNVNSIKIVFFICVIIYSFSSCTIQKRSFNRGYHIELRKKFNQKNENVLNDEQLITQIKETKTIDSIQDKIPVIFCENKKEKTTLEKTKKNHPFQFVRHEQKLDDTTRMKTFLQNKKEYIGPENEVDKIKRSNQLGISFLIVGLLILSLSTIVAITLLTEVVIFLDLIAPIIALIFGYSTSIVFLFAGLAFIDNSKRIAKKIINDDPNIKKNEVKETVEVNKQTKKRTSIALITIFTLLIVSLILLN